MTNVQQMTNIINPKSLSFWSLGLRALLVIGVWSLGISSAYAAQGVPRLISYQGRLLDSSGNLLGGSSGTNYCFRFSLYDAVTSGSQIWPAFTPSTMTASVKNGIYNVNIGDTDAGGDTLLPAAFTGSTGDTRWLNIAVANSSGGSCAGVSSFETLTPRQRLTASSYALSFEPVLGGVSYTFPSADGSSGQVLRTDGAATLSWGTGSQWTTSGNNVYYTTGGASVGASTTLAALTVNATSSADRAIVVRGAASQSANLFEWQNSTGTGLGAINSSGNVGIGTTGPGVKLDVWGVAGSSSSPAIFRQSDGTGGVAINAASDYGGFSIGSYWDGANWKALSTNQALFYKDPSALQFTIYGDTGLTVGNSFSPTKRVTVQLANGGMSVGTYAGTAAPSGGMIVSGNVGIGHTAPSEKLNVQGIMAAQVVNATSTTATSTFSGGFAAGNNAALVVNQAATANSLYINPSGNLGIGTTGPLSTLTVAKTSAGATADLIRLENASNAASTGAGITVFNATTDPTTDDVVGRILFQRQASDSQRLLFQLYNGVDAALETVLTFDPNGNGSVTFSAPMVVNSPGANAADFNFGGTTYISFTDNNAGTVAPRIGVTANDLIFATDATGGGSGGKATTERFRLGQTTQQGLLTISTAALKGFVVRGAASQSANLQEWQNSAGTVLTVVDASGNVGIGHTAPSEKLNVQGTIAGQLVNATSTTATSTFSGGFAVGNNAALVVNQAASANSLYINPSGNVGIGTTGPGAKLHVGTGDVLLGDAVNISRLSFYNNGNTALASISQESGVLILSEQSGQNGVALKATSSMNVRVDGSTGGVAVGTTYSGIGIASPTNGMIIEGNVGIGDTTPDYLLDVAGTLGIDGNMTFGDASGDTVTVNAGSFNFANAATSTLANVANAWNIDSSTLSIDALNNRVGIGTAAPLYSLHVNNTSAHPLNLQTDGDLGIRFADGANSQHGVITVGGSIMKVTAGGRLDLAGSSNGIQATTNFGLSDTSPDYALEIGSSGALAMSDSVSVAHGLTTLAQTDVFLHAGQRGSGGGGVQMTGLTDNNPVTEAFVIRGVIGSTNPTDSTPAVIIIGAKSNGTTGMADLAAAETVFQVANNDDTAGITMLGNGNVGIGTTGPSEKLDVAGTASSTQIISVATSTLARDSGNVMIGGTSAGTGCVKCLTVSGSTAPSASITDGIQLFAVDVGGLGHELRVRDEATNVTTLSPHNFSQFTPDEDYLLPWSFSSENAVKDLRINVDMYGIAQAVEALTGKQFIYAEKVSTDEAVDRSGEIAGAVQKHQGAANKVKTLLAQAPVVEPETIGQAEGGQPLNGIEMEDELTGEKYCVVIRGGQWMSRSGKCVDKNRVEEQPVRGQQESLIGPGGGSLTEKSEIRNPKSETDDKDKDKDKDKKASALDALGGFFQNALKGTLRGLGLQ